jgi:hypothetical protein
MHNKVDDEDAVVWYPTIEDKLSLRSDRARCFAIDQVTTGIMTEPIE